MSFIFSFVILMFAWSVPAFADEICTNCSLVKSLNLTSNGDFTKDSPSNECLPDSLTYIPANSDPNHIFATGDSPLKIVTFETDTAGCQKSKRNIATGRFISKNPLSQLFGGTVPLSGYIEFETNFSCINSKSQEENEHVCLGLWPGLWLIYPSGDPNYTWPYSSELDIVESNFETYNGSPAYTFTTTITIPTEPRSPKIPAKFYQAAFPYLNYANFTQLVNDNMKQGNYHKFGLAWKCDAGFGQCDFFSMLDGILLDGTKWVPNSSKPTFSVIKNQSDTNPCTAYSPQYQYIWYNPPSEEKTKLCDVTGALQKGFPHFYIILTQHVKPTLYKPWAFPDKTPAQGELRIKSIKLYVVN